MNQTYVWFSKNIKERKIIFFWYLALMWKFKIYIYLIFYITGVNKLNGFK